MGYVFVTCRNNSIKELDNFAENANALNRMILRHLSISEAYQPPAFRIGGMLEEDPDEGCGGISITRAVPSEAEGAIFHMDSDHSSDGEELDQPPVLWMSVSPPGKSSLALRRAGKKQDAGDNAPEERPKPPRYGRSPPKVSSAMF